MSGRGRSMALAIEAAQRADLLSPGKRAKTSEEGRTKGHRSRWQARIEGLDGRTLAKAEKRSRRMVSQQDDARREDAGYARMGLRVR